MSAFALAYAARRDARVRKEQIRAVRRPKEAAYRAKNPKRDALNRIKTGRGCERCGVKGLPPSAYDFHHRERDSKEFALSSSTAVNRPWERLRAEIEKCDVLCATCHRIVEDELRQSSS